MIRQATSKVAPVVSTELFKRMIICYTESNELPVDYSLLAESVFEMWDSDELDRLVINWESAEVPFLWEGDEHELPDQPNILTSSQEVKFNLQSNYLTFRDLQDGANDFCGDLPGFGSEFWLALEFDNKLVTGRKVPY